MLGVVSLAFANNASAQFTQSMDALDTLYAQNSSVGAFADTITNTGSSAITVIWNVDSAGTHLLSGWAVSACDNFTCPLYSYQSHTSNPIPAGASTNTPTDPPWTVEIDASAPGAAAGTGWLTEKLTDNNGTTHKTDVYIFTKLATGVSTITHSSDDVILYPNPARNEVNIIFNSDLGVKSVAICNLIGKTVSYFKTAGNSANLNIENLPSGIYFLRLMDANSNVVTTRKFTRM